MHPKKRRKKFYFFLRFLSFICAKSKKNCPIPNPAAAQTGIRHSAGAEFACPDGKIRKTIYETAIFFLFRSKIGSGYCFAAPWTKRSSFFPNNHESAHNPPTSETVPSFPVRPASPADWAALGKTTSAAGRAFLFHRSPHRPW